VAGITAFALNSTPFLPDFHRKSFERLKKKTFSFLYNKWIWPKPISEHKMSASNVTTEAFQT